MRSGLWCLLSLVACGSPSTRAEYTVYAPVAPPLAAGSTEPIEMETPAAVAPAPLPESPLARRLQRVWLRPLQTRDLAALVEAFGEQSVLTARTAAGSDAPGTASERVGRGALRGWLQGHVLALPYVQVQPSYLGPAARSNIEMVRVRLLDACGAMLGRLTAKLHVSPQGGYQAAEVQLRTARPGPCP